MKKHLRQVQKVGRQAVEEVGQDEFAVGELALAVSFGQKRIGGHAREKGHGKACADDVLEMADADYGRGQPCQEPGPVEGLDEVGDKKPQSQGTEQTQERPAKGLPDVGDVHGA